MLRKNEKNCLTEFLRKTYIERLVTSIP